MIINYVYRSSKKLSGSFFARLNNMFAEMKEGIEKTFLQ